MKQDTVGYSVSTAGDFNKDGFADVIVGGPSANIFGTAYVIFGKAVPVGGYTDIDLLTFTTSATTGFQVYIIIFV